MSIDYLVHLYDYYNNDGIFIGRYVLVDYDRDIKKSNGYETFLIV